VTHALALEWGILLVFAVTWQWASGTFPPPAASAAFIVLSALAMGVQSMAARRLDVSGIVTTYITGTLTSLTTRLMGWGRRRRTPTPRRTQPTPSAGLLAAVWGIYLGGRLRRPRAWARCWPWSSPSPCCCSSLSSRRSRSGSGSA
jgi:uncharacterized membrane protein YoaK (UPF0700 family)